MSKYSAWHAAIVFVILGIVCKLKVVPLETNFALFGAVAIFCGAYLRGFAAWMVPLIGLAASDLLGEWLQIPGVHRYDVRSMLFNYAGFAAMIAIGRSLRGHAAWERVLGTSVVGSLAFFALSNFGCWLDPLLQYDRSWSGLLQSYWMGLPFFRWTLASDVIFTLVFVAAHRFAASYATESAHATSDQ